MLVEAEPDDQRHDHDRHDDEDDDDGDAPRRRIVVELVAVTGTSSFASHAGGIEDDLLF